MRTLRKWLGISGLILTAAPAIGQEHGSIRATVLNDREELVRDAMALAMPIGVALGMALPVCKTDETGSCTISLSYFGKYSVSASKEDEGYPKQTFAFYAAQNPLPPEIVLSAEHPTENVVVHLGKRAGILTGTVGDAITGKALDAGVEFRWLNAPSNFLRGSGLTNSHFRILIPSDVPVTMVVSHAGYEDWNYSLGRGELRNAILLHSGEESRVDIRLLPKK